MIETLRLVIKERELKDIPMEEFYLSLHPEIKELDPPVGASADPMFFSVFTRGTDRHIGMCCLYNYTDTEIEIGLRIFATEYWGMGYGKEIVNALCYHAFVAFPTIARILMKTPVYNARAMNCYTKCGFVQYSRAAIEGYDMIFMMRERHQQ